MPKSKTPDALVSVVLFGQYEHRSPTRKQMADRITALMSEFIPKRRGTVQVDLTFISPNVAKWGIYPEVIGNRQQGETIPPPEFPRNCPACYSEAERTVGDECWYRCGGHYSQKPQIQNHTDVFWGTCGDPKYRTPEAVKAYEDAHYPKGSRPYEQEAKRAKAAKKS